MEEPTEPVESDRDQRGLRDVANKLDSKVAIVTGASSGIGEATSEALAAEGATVVAAARRE
jgi:3-oxoacyl-ACP reductase-like protein